MRKAHLGKAPWNKGKPMSVETKAKVSESKKKNPTRYWLGKKLPPEMARKLADSRKGRAPWNKGFTNPMTSGPNHYNWQGGRTPAINKRVNSLEWRTIRAEIYRRDGYVCQECGKHCRDDIQCHHIVPVEDGGSDDEQNLITLCRRCHLRIHIAMRKTNSQLAEAVAKT